SPSNIAGAPCTTSNQATCGKLDTQRKPVLDGTKSSVQSAASFALWFRNTDSNGVVDIATVPGVLPLTQDGSVQDKYTYSSSAFFPLNGIGHNTASVDSCDEETASCCSGTCNGRNYHFTT